MTARERIHLRPIPLSLLVIISEVTKEGNVLRVSVHTTFNQTIRIMQALVYLGEANAPILYLA